ncbi:branched-chain amino acid transporter permease [Neoactinobaculum massilliense]|uniref:branched-chain amino acid transporter permease n=1 Tax=Neoactinobaculum massilliense TaxID=2364794 RepID=UPI000F5415A9|nr:AzlD domain-containing protein [Neoactinobaculum massilliense]
MRYILLAVLVTWLITFALRAAPFVFLRRVRDSALLAYLGRTMPAAVMLILVVYTLHGVSFSGWEWVPPAAGIAVTVGLHLAFRNTLVSLIGGTAAFALALTLI